MGLHRSVYSRRWNYAWGVPGTAVTVGSLECVYGTGCGTIPGAVFGSSWDSIRSVFRSVKAFGVRLWDTTVSVECVGAVCTRSMYGGAAIGVWLRDCGWNVFVGLRLECVRGAAFGQQKTKNKQNTTNYRVIRRTYQVSHHCQC